MIPNSGGKAESNGRDSEQLSRAIEAELAAKRARWKNAAARRQKIRIASFFFLFLLILVSLLAFYVLFSRVNEERTNARSTPIPAAVPQKRP
jgi:hypothetical protein